MKINQNLVGRGGVNLFMVYLGYKKNFNFFFTLNIQDTKVSIGDFCKLFSAPQNDIENDGHLIVWMDIQGSLETLENCFTNCYSRTVP